MTPFIKKNEIKNNWLLINAENVIIGRLAAYISKALNNTTTKNKILYKRLIYRGDCKHSELFIKITTNPLARANKMAAPSAVTQGRRAPFFAQAKGCFVILINSNMCIKCIRYDLKTNAPCSFKMHRAFLKCISQ